jgi:hypothetical protein
MTSPIAAEPVRVFISYSRKDEQLREKLVTHLALLKQQNLIRSWYDREIGAGEDFHRAISKELATAEIILLLLSPDFLASEYCMDVELKIALERHHSATDPARLIPVIVRTCGWRHHEQLSRLNALPTDGRPIDEWPNADKAFEVVADALRKELQQIRGYSPMHDAGPSEARVVAPLARDGERHAFGLGGWLAPFCCDRDPQADVFSHACLSHFTTSPGEPMIVFVPGESRQSHSGFLQRTEFELLPEIADAILDAPPGRPHPVSVQWKAEGPAARLRWDLGWEVYRRCGAVRLADPRNPNPTAATLRKHEPLRAASFVLVSHTIEAEMWPASSAVLEWYLSEFWPRVIDRTENEPRFVLVFNIVYPAAAKSPGWLRLFRRPAAPASVTDLAAEAAARCPLPVKILDPLPPVTPVHVRAWFDRIDRRHFPWSENVRSRELARVFTVDGRNVATRDMIEVEEELKTMLQRLAGREAGEHTDRAA